MRSRADSLTLELGAAPLSAQIGARDRATIRFVRLVDRDGDLRRNLAALAALDLPALEFVELIHVYLHGDHVRGLEPLARLPAFCALRLDGCGLDAAGVAALARLPLLATIRDLSIVHADLTARRLRPLLESPHIDRLEALDLFANPLGTAGAELLAGASGLAALRELELSRCRIDPAALAVLLAGPWPALTSLTLVDNPLGDRGAELLGRSPLVARLTTLEIGACNIGPPGIRALVEGEPPLALERLGLFANPVGDDGAAHLAASARLPLLRRLELRLTGLADAGALALARGPLLAGVEELDLSDGRIADDGAVALADCPHFAALRSITLHHHPLGLRGALALRASPWPAVRAAARITAPTIAAPWPTSPRRLAVDLARAAVAGVDPRDGGAALRALVARGVVPPDLAADPRRRFRDEHFGTCRSCHGYPIDGAGDPCPWCVGGEELLATPDRTDPPTADHALAFAADVAVVPELERRARALVSCLAASPWLPAASAIAHLSWYFHRAPRFSPPTSHFLAPILAALASALDEPLLAAPRGPGWPLWAAHAWHTAAGRDPSSPFALHPDPFTAYIAVREHGYDVELTADALVLVAPRLTP